MASPTAERPAGSAPAAPDGVIPAEWPAQATDTIVETIDKVRDKTTRPALVAARAVVYGLLAAVVGSVGLIMLLVGTIRLADNYLPGNIWTIYAALFVVLSAGGLVALRKASQPAARP
ncbi:hypothetical protein BH23ACT2_BH23ACT2_20610 [soil metagenome]